MSLQSATEAQSCWKTIQGQLQKDLQTTRVTRQSPPATSHSDRLPGRVVNDVINDVINDGYGWSSTWLMSG